MIFNKLLRVVREALNLTQGDLADIANISRSAIAQYEAKRAALSSRTLEVIAPALHVNPAFITNPLRNPFRSSDLIHFRVDSPLTDASPLLQIILDHNKELKMLILLVPEIGKRHPKKPTGNKAVTALLIRDGDNNSFLLTPRGYWTGIDADEIVGTIVNYAKKISSGIQRLKVTTVDLTDTIIEKMASDRITIDDLNQVIEQHRERLKTLSLRDDAQLSYAVNSRNSLLQLTSGEEHLIRLIRELHIPPEELGSFVIRWQVRS